ncbi:MAG: glutathione S-transferase [Rickettsiales bacterium]|nr:glutathione S-transferase [Rickettsiales bacterium]
MNSTIPILYSFRRCPFAIRARLAIYFSKIKVEIREISLSNKPQEMKRLSKKFTVPILKIDDIVLDESLDIILWSLKNNDEHNLLSPYYAQKEETLETIEIFDHNFKFHLDRYKYSSRYLQDEDYLGRNEHKEQAANILEKIERILKTSKNNYIFKNRLSILDICLFPLVRQFRIADKNWFDSEFRFNSTARWLHNIIEQDYFEKIMIKYAEWVKEKKIQYFSYQDTNRIID